VSATVLGQFATKAALQDALGPLHAERLGEVETYTPEPMETGGSPLPLIVLLAGALGTAVGFALQTYATVYAYPLDIGGRPDFSWPSYIPIAVEIGALSAIVAGLLGYMIINRLPALYRPIDEGNVMRHVMRDGWCVAIRTPDPDRARAILQLLQAATIAELPA
jgi:ActD protein